MLSEPGEREGGRGLRLRGAFAAVFFEPDGEEGNDRRCNATDPGPLTKIQGADLIDALLGLAFQALDGVIVGIGRKRVGFLASQAVYLLALPEDVTFVFKVRFNEGPKFHGEQGSKL